jgi:FMN reductase
MSVVAVVGNPKPKSRTLEATAMVARKLVGREPDSVIDVATLGPGLLGFEDAGVARAVETVRAAKVLVVGSPTFKATFSGVLKVFLDQFPTDGLLGVTAFAVMVGGNPSHALAPELSLRPLLSEMGASCPAPGFYFVGEAKEDDPRFVAWLERVRPLVPRGA